MPVSDDSSLDRFEEAQRGTYESVLRELRAGKKSTHWMWFIFPQLRGLGRSETAHFYGIAGLDEAARYVSHPILGSRLVECTRAVMQHSGTPLTQIFGTPDDLKFVSCMTLFSLVPRAPAEFSMALQAFAGSQRDERTLQLLGSMRS